jgi:integrase
MIGWKDYPKPNLRFIRNVWVVEVSIPTSIRHLFGNGSGATNNKRKATGTIDKAIAERRVTELTHKIYKEFDDKQLDYVNRKDKQTDRFAENVINNLAKALKYNKGLVPLLEATTDYAGLVKMKARFDNAFEQVEDDRAAAEVGNASLEAKTFSPSITTLLSKHSQLIVQSFWQDLLTSAAIEQGVTPPIFEKLPQEEYLLNESDPDDLDKIFKKPPTTGIMGYVKQAHHVPVSRPRRNKSKSTENITSVLDEYFVALERDYAKKDTIRKLKKGVRLFVELMGDLPLQDIEQTTVYTFMDKQQEAKPNVSARVLKDNNWSLRNFFKFCVERGYVKINPLVDIDVGRRGMPGQTHLNYTRDELHTIFRHNWKSQERLLLSILITTGMRLSEAANLSWERFSEDHDGIQGMRCFSLLNTNDEIVAVKNKGSMRIIPLHPDLVLPPKGIGRLFDYKMNEDGLASHDAGRAINPTLQKLFPHPQKMAHSFRGTLKELLRDAGVSKEISDFYTGHSSGDVAGTRYGGVGVDTRYIEISKAQHPWLKYKSNLD